MFDLAQRYANEEWFIRTTDYWRIRFTAIETRLQGTFQYVDLATGNRNTYSYHFASILRDAGSVFASTLDALLRNVEGQPNTRLYGIKDYRRFLRSQVPDIDKWSVQLQPLFPFGQVVPFKTLRTNKASIAWWDAYNDVKHNEYEAMQKGNLENCINALSALALLGFWLRVFNRDSLFITISQIADRDPYILSVEQPLFPDTT